MNLGKINRINVHALAGGTSTSGYVYFTTSDIRIENTIAETTTTTTTTTATSTTIVTSTPSSLTLTEDDYGYFNDRRYVHTFADGTSSVTFNEDGSFSCTFENSQAVAYNYGLVFDKEKYYKNYGNISFDFELEKENVKNVNSSSIGIYGSIYRPDARFYIIDNWLGETRPEADNELRRKKLGNYEIDGAMYTVYNNQYHERTLDVITSYKVYYSIRVEPRTSGTIDIKAHFKYWEQLGMEVGDIKSIYAIVEAESKDKSGASGHVNFTTANIRVGDDPSKTCIFLKYGYECCPGECNVLFTDDVGDWDFIDGQWCGCTSKATQVSSCSSKITAQGYNCCSKDCHVIYEDDDGTWGFEDDWCGCNNA